MATLWLQIKGTWVNRLLKSGRWKCCFVIFGLFIFPTFWSEDHWYIKGHGGSLPKPENLSKQKVVFFIKFVI